MKTSTGEIRIMPDYVNAKEYAEIKGVPYEAVKSRVRYNLIPCVRVGRSTLIDRNTPWENVKKGRPEKSGGKVEKSKYHIEIKRAYYVAVCDNSGKEVCSDFTFLNKADAELIGKKMKAEVEKKNPS